MNENETPDEKKDERQDTAPEPLPDVFDAMNTRREEDF